jgi:hypothetical protein
VLIKLLTKSLTQCSHAAVLFACFWLPIACDASALAYVVGVNGNGEGGSGTIFGDGGSGTGQNCTTFGNPPSSPLSYFGSVAQAPGGGIGPCGYFGVSISDSQPVSFSMVASNRNGSSIASGSAFAALTPSSAFVNGQNLTGEFTLNAIASQSASEINGPTTIEQAVAAAFVDDPDWTVTAPGLSNGALLQPTYIWAIGANASLGSPFGDFIFELAMQQLSDQVNAVPVADYQASYSNPTPSCGFTCGTGYTIGPGFMSGTGVFTYTSNALIPVGVAEDEKVGLVVSANYNASIDPDATLVGVSFTSGGVPVTDFTLTTSVGIYTANGFTPFVTAVPETNSWILCAFGTVAITAIRKLRGSRRRKE